jgi:predicted dehydrogenase
MIELGVIGLGTIFPTQAQAVAYLKDRFHVAAVCDRLPEKRQRFVEAIQSTLPGAPPRVYADSARLWDDDGVEAVLIATPPATHFALAAAGLGRGKHILLEKPAVLDFAELETLYALAEENHVHLHIAYHAAFAQDLAWFCRHEADLHLGPISAIHCRFFDPYMVAGQVDPTKVSLGGCFVDSGVNALSVCQRLVALGDFRRTQCQEKRDTSGTVYAACHRFESQTCRITVETGWDRGVNHKSTELSFRNSDTKLLLHHSNQSVVLLERGQERILYAYDQTPRLLTHDRGVLADFAQCLARNVDNRLATVDIHRLLLTS